MQHTDDKQVNFGRWLWWKIYFTFNGNRTRAMQELDRSWSSLRNYSLRDTPEGIPNLALAELERRLKLPLGSIRETYLHEPMPPIPMDPRGRKPGKDRTVKLIKLAVPLDLAERLEKRAKAESTDLHDAIIEAIGDWVYSFESEVIGLEESSPHLPKTGARKSAAKRAGSVHRR